MIEDHSVTCRFGVRPRQPVPAAAGRFGSPEAIAPWFGVMPTAEQQAAINLMLEAGRTLAAIASALGKNMAEIEALRDRRCRPVAPPSAPDLARGRSRSGLLARPVSKSAADHAIDETLRAIDAHRAQAGGALDAAFELTLDDLCQAGGFGPETARRRLKELESRKWLRRTLRPGLPPLVLIALAGRCRLEALAARREP